MNVSLAWLRDFVDTPTKGAELGERFRMTSSELEGLQSWGALLEGLTCGYVELVEPHPDADKLRIATISLGVETRKIVCGAPNLAAGQTVIVALPGTTIHPVGKEPFTIGEAKIRGVASQGMLCALEEIGIQLPSEGIFVFPEAVKPGTPVATALMESDIVLDLEITPNRPDLLSHVGLAREVAAFERRRLTEPAIATLESRRSYSLQLDIHIVSHKDCARYAAIALEHSAPTPSPWWLQSRLIRCGIRPVNCIVDVTNYVMLELGQPMHAFDAKLLGQQGNKLRLEVRRAASEESLVLLDGSTRSLTSEDLVVASSSNKPVAVAGIMGSKGSEVSSSTQLTILEAATFSGPRVRKTSRRLGLRTEASSRFEKGLDSELVVTALKRAVYLLQQISDAKQASNLVENSASHQHLRPRIHVSFDRVHQLLGVRISAADCKAILTKLGFQLPIFTKSGFDAVPPSWRHDIALAEDVIEELIRIWGYDHLPVTMPVGAVKAPSSSLVPEAKRKVRYTLAAAGSHEAIHIPFCSANALQRLGYTPSQAIALRNPLSAETAYLSPNHLIGILADCGTVNSEFSELSMFEIGKTFTPPTNETETLTLLVRTGEAPEHAVRKAKQLFERVCQVLSLPKPSYQASKPTAYAEAGETVHINETLIGHLLHLSDAVVAAHKIRRGRQCVALEVNLETLLSLPTVTSSYQPVPTYPTSIRDTTVTVGKDVPLQTLLTIARDTINPQLVSAWQVTTIFTDKPVPDGHKAVTFRLTYNSPKRTLEDEEIKKHHSALEKALENV